MTPDDDLGQRPHPNSVPCEDCGHVWFEGERRHDYVEADGAITIEDGADVACTLCRQKRARGRNDDDEQGYVAHW
jgi:hypothetical protein